MNFCLAILLCSAVIFTLSGLMKIALLIAERIWK